MRTELEAAAEDMRRAQGDIQLHSSKLGLSVEASARDAADLHFRQSMATSKQAVYETLLARYQQMLAEQQYVGSDIRVVSPATIPVRPSFPKPLLYAAVAGFASLVLGFGLSVLTTLLFHRNGIEEAAAYHQVFAAGG